VNLLVADSEFAPNLYAFESLNGADGAWVCVQQPDGSRVSVYELPLAKVSSARWNAMAARTLAVVRGTLPQIFGWAVNNFGRARVRLFEIWLERTASREQIGQCAVAQKSDGTCAFLPSMQLLPEHDDCWAPAMRAILSRLGPAQCSYGWNWNIEPPREATLAGFSGVEVTSVTPFFIQAVDFSQWSSWDDYHRAISENARRNAKSAERNHPDLAIDHRRGLGSLRHVPALVRLQEQQARRYGWRESSLAGLIHHTVLTLACPQFSIAAAARAGGKTLAVCNAWAAGSNVWYLSAASERENGGAAWRLLIEMLRFSYERSPKGKFVMGHVDYAIHDEAEGGGLLRSRRSCRTTDYPASIVSFRYTGRA
jgi:hypothetical protein